MLLQLTHNGMLIQGYGLLTWLLSKIESINTGSCLRKEEINSYPWGLPTDSGWNWIPKIGYIGCLIPMTKLSLWSHASQIINLFLGKIWVSYFWYTYAVKTMIFCTCFWLAAKSVQSVTIYEKLIGSKLILETFRDFWELQRSAVMQFRKEKLQ